MILNYTKLQSEQCNEKIPFLAYADHKGPDQPVHLQSDQGLCCLQTESMDTRECIRRAKDWAQLFKANNVVS